MGKGVPETAVATVEHVIDGRMRLAVRERKGDRTYFEQLADALVKIEGISEVDARPLTASVVIKHSAAGQGLLDAVCQAGNLRLLEEDEADEGAPEASAESLRASVDMLLRQAAGQGVTLRAVVAMAFLIMALRQLAAGNVMPPAATSFWYGLSLLLDGKPQPVDPTET